MRTLIGIGGKDAATPEHTLGVMRDDVLPRDGTEVKASMMSDIYYGMISVIVAAGLIPDGTSEGVITSQFRDALLILFGSTSRVSEEVSVIASFHPTTILSDATGWVLPVITKAAEYRIYANCQLDWTQGLTTSECKIYLNLAKNGLSIQGTERFPVLRHPAGTEISGATTLHIEKKISLIPDDEITLQARIGSTLEPYYIAGIKNAFGYMEL